MPGEQPLFDSWTLDTVQHPALWPPADDTVMSTDEAAEWLWGTAGGGDALNTWRTPFGDRVVDGDNWAAHRAAVADGNRAVASWGAGSETESW